MLKKKIIVVIIVLTALILSVVPVGSYSVANIHFGAEISTLYFRQSSSGEFIDLIFDNPSIFYEDIKNNDSLLFEFAPLSPHIGIVAGTFLFEFPSAEYLSGQSYNFSFKLNGSQTSNDTSLLIPPADPAIQNLLLLNYSLFSSWYNLGDKVPSWDSVYNRAYFYDNNEYTPLAVLSNKLWNNSIFSFDFSIPSNYFTSVGGNVYENKLVVHFLMRTNYVSEKITLSEFSLIPTGATKQLYAQQEHNLLVEEKLSDIQGELQEGFSNISGELNEGFSYISGELEEGFSNLLEQPEQEKQEAGNTGNNALDSILGGVDDKSPGVINAFSSLVSALSYNGTDAKWQVPPIKLPAIDGLWDEIVLSDNVEIDFNYWIDKLPPTIITLSQALTTIAFIIYCFKELYDIISYVLTLRRS